MDEVIVLGYSRLVGGAVTLTNSVQSISAFAGFRIAKVQIQAKIGNAAAIDIYDYNGTTVIGQLAAGSTLQLDLNNLLGFQFRGEVSDVLYYRALVI
jgi:hypothetical protein